MAERIRSHRVLVSVLAGALLLIGLTWYDASILSAARSNGAASGSITGALILTTLGILALAGSIMALAGLAWWARSAVTGLVYALVGAFFVVVPLVLFSTSSAFPDPITKFLTDFLVATSGPLNASIVLGAGMFLSGLVAFYRAWFAAAEVPANTAVSPGRAGRPSR